MVFPGLPRTGTQAAISVVVTRNLRLPCVCINRCTRCLPMRMRGQP